MGDAGPFSNWRNKNSTVADGKKGNSRLQEIYGQKKRAGCGPAATTGKTVAKGRKPAATKPFAKWPGRLLDDYWPEAAEVGVGDCGGVLEAAVWLGAK